MATVPRAPETTYNWRDICERVDGPNRHLDSLYPIVYYFESGGSRRDSGPLSGIYHPGPAPVGPTDITLSNLLVQEKVTAAPVGTVTVIGPNVAYVFTVVDQTNPATQWTVVNNLLRLADGQQVIFNPAQPTHSLEITAVAPNNAFVTRTFPITVQKAIVPPPPNAAPTDILLDNPSVPEATPGAIVGNLTVVDSDLPLDTEVITCSDGRFFVTPGAAPGTGVLALKPGVEVFFVDAPTIAINLTARDTGGLTVTVLYVLSVTAIGPTDIQLSDFIVQEKTAAAPVGTVTVIGPDVPYTFVATDLTDSEVRWVVVPDDVVASLLRLGDGQEILFDPLKPTHTVEITARAPNTLSVTRDFVITVQQQIIPPPPNHAPTNITLDNLTVLEKTSGATVGNITVADSDLPSDTEVITCSDARFVIIPGATPGTGVLKLQPATQVLFSAGSTISLTLTATDSGGLFITLPFTISVTPLAGRAHSQGFDTGFN